MLLTGLQALDAIVAVVMADKPVSGAAVVVMLGGGPNGIGITAGAVSQDDGTFTLQGVPMGR